jgi:hypothetical protein
MMHTSASSSGNTTSAERPRPRPGTSLGRPGAPVCPGATGRRVWPGGVARPGGSVGRRLCPGAPRSPGMVGSSPIGTIEPMGSTVGDVASLGDAVGLSLAPGSGSAAEGLFGAADDPGGVYAGDWAAVGAADGGWWSEPLVHGWTVTRVTAAAVTAAPVIAAMNWWREARIVSRAAVVRVVRAAARPPPMYRPRCLLRRTGTGPSGWAGMPGGSPASCPLTTAASVGGPPSSSSSWSLVMSSFIKFTRARWARISRSTRVISRLSSASSPRRRRKKKTAQMIMMLPSAPTARTEVMAVPCRVCASDPIHVGVCTGHAWCV